MSAPIRCSSCARECSDFDFDSGTVTCTACMWAELRAVRTTISTLTARAAAERERDEALRAVEETAAGITLAQQEIATLRAELERVTGDLNFSTGRLDYVTDRLQTVVRVLEEECGPWDGAAPVSPVETRIRLLATRARDAEAKWASMVPAVLVALGGTDPNCVVPADVTAEEMAMHAGDVRRALEARVEEARADSSRLRAAVEDAAETFRVIAANLEGRMYRTAKAQAKNAAKSYTTAALSPAPGEAKACGDAGVCARPSGHGDPHASVALAADLGRDACRYPHPTASDLACSREVGHVGVHQLVGSPECWLTRTAPILDAETEIAMQELKTFGEAIEINPTPTPPEEARGKGPRCGAKAFTLDECELPAGHAGSHQRTRGVLKRTWDGPNLVTETFATPEKGSE